MARIFVESWDKFCVCITPEELKDILGGLHLVKTSGPVPADYRQTPTSEYAAMYGELLARLCEPEPEPGNVARLDGFALVQTLPGGSYADVQEYRQCFRREETVIMELFSLKCWPVAGKTTLSTSFSHWQEPEAVVGIRFLCPKNLSCWQEDGTMELVSTADMDFWKEYQGLKKRIRAMTKPLRVTLEGREVRTAVRVSSAMGERLEELYFFRSNPVKIIR